MADERLLIEIDAKVDSSVAGIAAVNKGLSATPQIAAKAGAALSKMEKSAAGTTTALTNFGRVVQDAPFGILGIANNIDPLVTSFQALRKSTGSTGAALKSMVGGLTGPAGIGIAISAVTSLVIAFGDDIVDAIFSITAFDKAAREAASEGAKAYAGALRGFQKLVDIANNSSLSSARQKDALDDANKALKEYGLQIDNVSTLQKHGIQIGAIYAQIKREEAKESILAKKAAEEYAKGVESVIAFEQKDILGVLGNQSIWQNIKTFLSGGGAGVQALKNLSTNLDDAAVREKQFNDEADRSRDAIQALIKDLDNISGVTEDFGNKTKKAAVDLAALRKAANDALDAEMALRNRLQGGVSAAGERQVQVITTNFKIRDEEAKKDLETLVRQIQQQKAIQNGLVIPVKLNVGPVTVPLSQANQQIKDAQATLAANHQAFMDNLSAITRNSVAGAISAMAEGIGNLLSGAATPFQAFFNLISSAMKQFGESLIAFGTAKVALDKLFKGPQGGPLAIAAGIGLVALATVIKNFTGPKLAEGGIVNGPTLAMVGDNPGKKEAIIPIEKWDMLNAGGGVVVMDTRISGNDLLLIQRRAQASFQRTNG